MLLEKIFGKKQPEVSVDVISFNMKHVSTGQVGAYIKKLYREEHFLHIGYRWENGRFVIYTLPGNKEVIQYFKDRCPAMVENECRALEDEAHNWATWPNGFEEVKNFNLLIAHSKILLNGSIRQIPYRFLSETVWLKK